MYLMEYFKNVNQHITITKDHDKILTKYININKIPRKASFLWNNLNSRLANLHKRGLFWGSLRIPAIHRSTQITVAQSVDLLEVQINWSTGSSRVGKTWTCNLTGLSSLSSTRWVCASTQFICTAGFLNLLNNPLFLEVGQPTICVGIKEYWNVWNKEIKKQRNSLKIQKHYFALALFFAPAWL